MFSRRFTAGFLIVICIMAIAFSMIVRYAIRQVTHNNSQMIETAMKQFSTNIPPEQMAGYGNLLRKLETNVTLSTVRENWDDACILSFWGGLIIGIPALIVFQKSKPNSQK